MNNLKKIRESRHLTQEQAGELCRVQRGYLSRLESGKIGLTEGWIRTFCRIYHCTPNEILNYENEPRLSLGIDIKILRKCFVCLIELAAESKKKLSCIAAFDRAIKFYEIVEEDNKRGNESISIGAAKLLLKDIDS